MDLLRISPRVFYVCIPVCYVCYMFCFFSDFIFFYKNTKTENPKNVNKCQKWNENIKDARRNSEQIRRIQTFWGPLFDHFPGFNNFPQIGQNGPIPQTVQFWNSGQASGLESQGSGSIPPVCSNLSVSGWAQGFFPQAK